MDEEDELDYFELEILRAGERKDFIDDEVLICECMCISAGEIRRFLSENQLADVDLETLKRELNLGRGCGSCMKRFSQWKEKIYK